MKLSIAILIVLLVSVTIANTDVEYSKLTDVFATIQNPCEDVRNGQFICQDCGTLAFCTQENGAWHSMQIAKCDTDFNFFCDEQARGCIFKTECMNRGPKFECQNVGMFPDPYDCKQYHVCDATMTDDRKICPQGTAYSPATKSCSLSSTNDICFKPQYKCDNWLDMAPWPTDSNIYYVCWQTNYNGQMVRYPLLHRCADGYVFTNNGCLPASSGSTGVGQSCDMGSPVRVDTQDCYSYYVCRNGQLERFKCPSGTYFNSNAQNCQFGSC